MNSKVDQNILQENMRGSSSGSQAGLPRNPDSVSESQERFRSGEAANGGY